MRNVYNYTNISIECGKTTNSIEELEILCQEEAKKL